ncbi:MAG: biotin/lipoyl-binding protein, partial [Dolichospermum sp.]
MVSVPTVLLLLVSGYQVLNYQQKITKKAQADISVTSTNVIAADGYLEPKGEVISVSLPFGMERARIEKLKVKRGEWVKAGDIIAVLDSNGSMAAALENAHSQEQIASAQQELIKAGAKKGEIAAQKAKVLENRAELNG